MSATDVTEPRSLLGNTELTSRTTRGIVIDCIMIQEVDCLLKCVNNALH